MKVTGSMPDDDFEKVRPSAQQADEVTEAIDRGLESVGSQHDEFVAAASRRTLEKTDW